MIYGITFGGPESLQADREKVILLLLCIFEYNGERCGYRKGKGRNKRKKKRKRD